MRNKRRTDEEWLSLIQQCRSSGLSDRVWCNKVNIIPQVSLCYVYGCFMKQPYKRVKNGLQENQTMLQSDQKEQPPTGG